MVKPILLYASDFWGCLKLPKNNPIERLHNMFCKQLLGVQKQTNTIGILLGARYGSSDFSCHKGIHQKLGSYKKQKIKQINIRVFKKCVK